jgi:glycosyltransferase involved in cell wall biosynthesis
VPFTNLLVPAGRRRVLMLLPWMRVGGADRFALDLAAGLIARGDRVSVALTRGDEPHAWLGELQTITSDVFDLPSFLAAGDFPRFLRYLIESRAITHVWISNSILAYQLLPLLRAHCPQVAYVDYNHLEQPFRHGGLPQVGVEHSELLDLHIAASQHLRDWMVARGADAQRAEVCTINVDAGRWAPDPELRARVRGELGLAEETPLILFVARLSAQKRVKLAAEVLRRLRDAGTHTLTLVAGDGEDAPWLRGFVRWHRLGRQVQLLGAVPNARVRELMAAADILLLPSEHEGIALTLYEAMASGIVPVASDVGGQRELVTPECGVLVPHGPGEVEAYVAALRRLAGNYALRAAMGSAGRARVLERFDMPQMLDRMQALLDRAAALSRESPRPPVAPGVGMAMATLAIEHYQLEQRLRALPPARLLLRLRHSSFARAAGRLGGLRGLAERLDRAIYVARRTAVRQAKRLLGRPYAP